MSDEEACTPRIGQSSVELDEMWRRQVVWWHLLFGVLLVATLVVVAFEAGEHLLWQVVCVVGIAAAYGIWGWRGLGDENRRAAMTYAVVAWSLMVVLTALDGPGSAWVLTFGLFPQTWASLPRNRAAVTVVVAIIALAIARVWQAPRTEDELVGIAISTIIMLVLSVTLGLFIDRVVREADSRAQTIDELHATQAKLAAVERAQGVEEERSRLSREIHDTLAQGFTSVIALSRAATAALDRDDAAAVRERLAMIERTATDNLAEARVIVAELTPGHLQSRTLGEALTRLAETVTRETGIRVDAEVAGEPVPLGGNAEVVVLRAAQEALSNVRRHSGARTARIVLSYAAQSVTLCVTDDGGGFDPTTATTGFGLHGLRARAGEVGGTVSVTPGEPCGTRLELELSR
ncbi:signal transduction histidine kinase [Knoellia remsis]|uniref:histidine kinase n=1 Tax=Knoellia remsis TaxID=407159 RepID=A0A2T0UJV8_9MICO|nr:sensor histidine kinase [Knoellia remsis]PRY58231.1 signal transduction histidine kinase [Knoellia remsis]